MPDQATLAVQGRLPFYLLTDESEMAREVYRLCIANEREQSGRREWAGRLGSLYEGLSLSSFHLMEFCAATSYGDAAHKSLLWEEAASICDTMQAKIAGLDDPKPQVMVTDGTYEDRRAGKWLDRFITGQMSMRQGMFLDMWDLWKHAYLTSIVATGTVAVRICADENAQKIEATISDTLDMWCDDYTNYPRTYGDTNWQDAEMVADEASPADRDLIWMAATNPKDRNPRTGDWTASTRLVRVCEAWRCQVGKKKGVYIKTVEGHPLDKTAYTSESPPYVFLTPKRRLKGMWGRPQLQLIYEPILEENRVMRSITESEKRVPRTICYFDPNVVARDKLSITDDVLLIPYDSSIGPAPNHMPPAFFHPNAIQVIDLHNQKIHDIPGMSEMVTAGRKETGIDAGVAIRAMESQTIQRHSIGQKAYINAVAVDTAYQIARACKQLGESNPNFASTWKGQGFLKKIPAKDVMDRLDDDRYVYDVQATSGLKGTPADRLQTAWELMQSKTISGETYLAIKKNMDVEGETNRTDIQRNYFESRIEDWLDATPGKMNDPDMNEEPPKWVDQLDAIAQLSDAYLQAIIDKAPSFIRQFFLSCLTQLSEALDAKTMHDAQVAGVSRGHGEVAAPVAPLQQAPAVQPQGGPPQLAAVA